MQREEFQPTSFKSVSSAEYSVDPEVRLREAEREKQQQQAVVRIDDLASDSSHPNADGYTIRSVKGATIDEDYYLIDTDTEALGTATDVNTSFPMDLENPTGVGSLDFGALASKLRLLESTSLITERAEGGGVGGRRRVSSVGGVACGELTEVMLGGGEVHRVKVPVEKCGTAVIWEFSTEPRGIAFGISYKEDKDASREDEVSG